MMKVRLLNDGGFPSLADIVFPVEVEARCDEEIDDCSAIYVHAEELIKVGAKEYYYFEEPERYFIGNEFEVIE